ncbi:hypothetical protein CTI12_AA630210 [Artemisia annua]|uniref:DUF1664 domain-containing protein n=1 Tax=Artemisia annua TaxID=35608 RepID=A0A2U1K917_ARTAN|nr:hypothetical protein CTI12_AA630210 [Artemisia annua]
MSLPVGKLAIIIGAGLVGSVFANRGFISGAHDLYSGANKVLKLLSNDGKSGSRPKPSNNNSLMAQVNNLRQELQLLASNQQVSIVTSTKSGTGKYKIIVIVVVVGYGYAWWKGWKLPNMMFATKRSLSDAMNVVAKKLDDVYLSLSTTKRHITSRIDRVNSRLDEFAESNESTQDEVSSIRRVAQETVQQLEIETSLEGIEGRQTTKRHITSRIDRVNSRLDEFAEINESTQDEVSSIRRVAQETVQQLEIETSLEGIEGRQNVTNMGVVRLLRDSIALENQTSPGRIQANPNTSSRLGLPSPQMVGFSEHMIHLVSLTYRDKHIFLLILLFLVADYDFASSSYRRARIILYCISWGMSHRIYYSLVNIR